MSRILLPTDVELKAGRFSRTRENSSNDVVLDGSSGAYEENGLYTTPVLDIGSGANTRYINLVRPESDPGSLGSPIQQRASSTAPTYMGFDDDFKGYGLDTARWSVTVNTNASYAQTSGALRMHCDATDGAKLFICNGHTKSADDSRVEATFRIVSVPETGGEYYIGLQSAKDSSNTFTPASGYWFGGLKITSAGCYAYGYSSTTTGSFWLAGVPKEFSVMFHEGNPTCNVWFRCGRYYVLLATVSYTRVPAPNYHYLTLYNNTSNGQTLDVDVTKFEWIHAPNGYTLSGTNFESWQTNTTPHPADSVWKSVVLSDNFKSYTDNLSIRPSTNSTWEDIGEGLTASGANGYKYPCQWETYCPNVSLLTNAYLETVADPAYAFVTWGGSSQGQYLYMQTEGGLGMLDTVPVGSMFFSHRHYHGSGTGIASTTVPVMRVYFYDKDGKVVFYYDTTYSDSNGTTLHSSIYNYNGKHDVLTLAASNDSTDTTLLAWDQTQGIVWMSNYRGTVGGTWTAANYTSSVNWLVSTGATLDTDDGTEINNAGAIHRILIGVYQPLTVAMSHVVGPITIVSGKASPHGTASGCTPYNNASTLQWRHPTAGTNQADYYTLGRYSQSTIKLIGE